MTITKTQLRRTALHYRRLMDPQVFEERNRKLNAAVLDFVAQKHFATVHAFLSIQRNREPDLGPILPELRTRGLEIVASRTDFQKREMMHYLLDAHTAIVRNEKGIPEPAGAVLADLQGIDCVFVPLVLADLEGRRIGYGGGYYDAFLKETKAVKVGLSLANPVEQIVQIDDWDVPLNYLITPFKTYSYG